MVDVLYKIVSHTESKPVSLGQTTQTVVLTTSSQQGQEPVLSLPIGEYFTIQKHLNCSIGSENLVTVES